jgi:tripartite-type tricarboxylate transporter receptor subunit TctC
MLGYRNKRAESLSWFLLRTTLFAALTLVSVGIAKAQEWPVRYVKFIVAGAAGSAPDVTARIVSNDLSQKLGQQIIIENKPGAGGNLGTEAGARAMPDGYTFLFGQAAPLALNQYTFKDIGFNVERDFDPVIMIGTSPMMIAASRLAKINTLSELVEKAKAEPGKISFGTSSSKNIPHSTGELLKTMAGINIVHIPYRNNPQVVADTIGGTLQIMIDGLPVIMPQVTNKTLIPLAVTSTKRLPGLEEIPTVAESYPGFEVTGWFVILAPHGTPNTIIEKLNRATEIVLKKPEIIVRLGSLGVYPDPSNTTPAQLKEYMRAQSQIFGNIARDAHLTAE